MLQQGLGLRRRRRRQTNSASSTGEPESQRVRLSDSEEDDFMEIINEKTSESLSRKTRTIDFDIIFKQAPSIAMNVNDEMTNAIKAMYARLFKLCEEPPIQILVQVFPPNFNGEPFTIPLRPYEQNNPDAVAEAILQANEKYNAGLELFDGKSHIRILAVWPLKQSEGLLIILIRNYLLNFSSKTNPW